MNANAGTVDLVRDAGSDLAQLVKSELAVAREELSDDVRRLEANAIALGTTAVLTIVGVELLLGALVAAGRRHPSFLATLGLASLGLGAAMGREVVRDVPRVLTRTRARLRDDAAAMQEVLG